MPPATHLTAIRGQPTDRLRALLAATRDLAQAFAADPASVRQRLAGRLVANLFFEDSTRTRTSFSIAARRLGADAVDLFGQGSSISKGETLTDTARTVEAMGVDAIMVRARQSGAAADIARAFDDDGSACCVINAGDGRHEHPTQALLDAYTLAEATGRLGSGGAGPAGHPGPAAGSAAASGGTRSADGFEAATAGPAFDFRGLRILIVGDLASSRVAGSNIPCLTALGAEVVCIGPPDLAPAGLAGLAVGPGRCRVGHELDPELPHADAVMMLRIQFERHGGGGAPGAKPAGAHGPGGRPDGGTAIASPREYRAFYGLTAERARTLLKPGCLIMHPGPINRGLEIDGEVADHLGPGPAAAAGHPLGHTEIRSVILRQVANGVLLRMAVLDTCLSRP